MKYPIGIQSFDRIIEDGYVYIDKTDMVYSLAQEGSIYFLSRPRRFGKSLLVSTLKNYFLGRKELFRGLKIDSLEKYWKVYPVFYIMHRTAQVTDAGLEWSEPKFLNIKTAANEKFTGVCPGRGITMTYNGTERIIFPLYDNRTGNELASVIYSDDGGATWQRGEHNSNLNGVGKTSESQVVLLPNGDLRMYSRNTINYVSYADSSDGGVTWSQCQPDQALFSQKSGGGCMVSFINLEGTLIGPDDQKYDNLILGSYARIQRSEGVVRIGSVAEDGTVTWLNDDATRYTGVNNCFAYSCVSQLQENGKATDTFAILYENQSPPCQIAFETLTVQDLLGDGWYMIQDESEKITLTLEPQFVNLSVGQSGQVQAIVTPEDAATITWSSDNPAVATVSDTGVVTAVRSGTATITATATASNGIVRTAKLSVAVQDESGITLPPCFQDTISSEEHEAQTTYDLDTDGIDAEGVYAIYHAGTQRILYHANGQSNTDQVTGSVSNNQLTLDGQYAASRQLWRITQTEEGYTIQSLEADGAYLRLNDAATQPGARVPVQSGPYTLTIQPGATPGSYTISHTVGDQELYLSHSSEPTKQYNVSTESCEFQLFLQTTIPAHTTYQVSTSGLRELVAFVDTLDTQDYAPECWEALQAAKQAANDFLASDDAPVFDNEADAQARLEQVTALTQALYQAWMDLVPPHTYGQPDFQWAEDFSQATATFICTYEGCGHTETVNAVITTQETPATCTEPGSTTYLATVVFQEEPYTAQQVVKHDALGHDFSVLCHDETNHWYQCSRCSATTQPEAHSGGTATCQEKAVCAICQTAYGDLAAHTPEAIPGKVPTCTETGLSEGSQCSVCHTVLVAQETLPATGHSYSNGVCTVCGAKDPDAEKPTPTPTPSPAPTSQPEGPAQTGDTANLPVLSTTMAISALCLLLLMDRARRAKH